MKKHVKCRYCGEMVNEADILCPYCKGVNIFPEYISSCCPPIPPTFDYFISGAESILKSNNIKFRRCRVSDINIFDKVYIGDEIFECVGSSKEGMIFQTTKSNTLFFIKYESHEFECCLLQLEGRRIFGIQNCLYVLNNYDAVGSGGGKFFTKNPSYWQYFKNKNFIKTLNNNENFLNSDGNLELLNTLSLHPEFLKISEESKCSNCGSDVYKFECYNKSAEHFDYYLICSKCGNCKGESKSYFYY